MHANVAASPSITMKEFALRNEMRKLWEDHVTWTRVAIISLVSGSPDTNASVTRLLRNQSDIGNAIKPFYGPAAGKQLTVLLREHITIAADLIAAAKAGDKTKLAATQAAWQQNGDRIAVFLNGANPQAWKLGELKAMFGDHLRLTTQEAVARLQGKMGGGRPSLRPDPRSDPRDGRHALSRHRAAVPAALPLTTSITRLHDLTVPKRQKTCRFGTDSRRGWGVTASRRAAGVAPQDQPAPRRQDRARSGLNDIVR